MHCFWFYLTKCSSEGFSKSGLCPPRQQDEPPAKPQRKLRAGTLHCSSTRALSGITHRVEGTATSWLGTGLCSLWRVVRTQFAETATQTQNVAPAFPWLMPRSGRHQQRSAVRRTPAAPSEHRVESTHHVSAAFTWTFTSPKSPLERSLNKEGHDWTLFFFMLK